MFQARNPTLKDGSTSDISMSYLGMSGIYPSHDGHFHIIINNQKIAEFRDNCIITYVPIAMSTINYTGNMENTANKLSRLSVSINDNDRYLADELLGKDPGGVLHTKGDKLLWSTKNEIVLPTNIINHNNIINHIDSDSKMGNTQNSTSYNDENKDSNKTLAPIKDATDFIITPLSSSNSADSENKKKWSVPPKSKSEEKIIDRFKAIEDKLSALQIKCENIEHITNKHVFDANKTHIYSAGKKIIQNYLIDIDTIDSSEIKNDGELLFFMRHTNKGNSGHDIVATCYPRDTDNRHVCSVFVLRNSDNHYFCYIYKEVNGIVRYYKKDIETIGNICLSEDCDKIDLLYRNNCIYMFVWQFRAGCFYKVIIDTKDLFDKDVLNASTNVTSDELQIDNSLIESQCVSYSSDLIQTERFLNALVCYTHEKIIICIKHTLIVYDMFTCSKIAIKHFNHEYCIKFIKSFDLYDHILIFGHRVDDFEDDSSSSQSLSSASSTSSTSSSSVLSSHGNDLYNMDFAFQFIASINFKDLRSSDDNIELCNIQEFNVFSPMNDVITFDNRCYILYNNSMMYCPNIWNYRSALTIIPENLFSVHDPVIKSYEFYIFKEVLLVRRYNQWFVLNQGLASQAWSSIVEVHDGAQNDSDSGDNHSDAINDARDSDSRTVAELKYEATIGELVKFTNIKFVPGEVYYIKNCNSKITALTCRGNKIGHVLFGRAMSTNEILLGSD
jgi:hypothetical protein